jgi:hypothetical protein
MSEPKRYTISGLHPHIIESKDGFMVYYEDYARLADEVALMNQLFDKYLTPEMRKAIVKVVRSKYPR